MECKLTKQVLPGEQITKSKMTLETNTASQDLPRETKVAGEPHPLSSPIRSRMKEKKEDGETMTTTTTTMEATSMAHLKDPMVDMEEAEVVVEAEEEVMARVVVVTVTSASNLVISPENVLTNHQETTQKAMAEVVEEVVSKTEGQ
jgi:hypothetical protein